MSNNKNVSESFIQEFPLVVSPSEEKILLVRLNCARQLYNACLGEGLKRLNLMRQSKDFLTTLKMEKGKEQAELFKNLDKQFKFREYDLHSFTTATKNACHIKDHLDTHVCQKIATRVFQALQEYSFGKRRKPRFNGVNQLDSVEGKTNSQGIRWKDGQVVWGKLKLAVMFDNKDKYGVQANALASRVKYVRIVRRKIKGKNRFYTQLVLEGKPLVKHPVGVGVVGLDIGPSTVAIVSEKEAILTPFCPELDIKQAEIRVSQRKLDRSRRANNPKAFNKNGTIKPGVKLKKSKAYRREQKKLAELRRKQKAQRKTSHGTLANKILSLGNKINTEKLSYKGWQKGLFGKSVGNRAPGMFMEILRRKAGSAGGEVNEFPVRNKLSQICHCGQVKKKGLSVRWHNCECGAHAQRDLYSAFLAMHVVGNELDICQAQKAWPGAEPLLRDAISSCNQTVIGKACFSSLGLNQGQNGSHREGESPRNNAGNVVAAHERESRKVLGSVPRTPGL